MTDIKKTYGVLRAGLTRRQSLLGFAPVLAAGFLATRQGFAATPPAGDAISALKQLEQREGGRLGVAAVDTATGKGFGWRQDERFALCSTFKLLLAGMVLARVDAGAERLDRALAVTADDMTHHAPVTEKHVGGTMTVGELCHATVSTSDNPAGNILMRALGGPEALTAWLRSIGDEVSRLDRWEPEMNNQNVADGDLRDTSTPAAMAATLQTLTLGEVLTPGSKALLIDWLKATSTGPDRLRRGLPNDWAIGHKTGTGRDGPTNDVAIAWPPGRAPVIVSVYYDRKGRTMKENATILAEVGRIAEVYI